MNKFIQTDFPGLIIVEAVAFGDDRGHFFESYNKEEFENNGIKNIWVQDNQSKSCYGVIRGLHFQTGDHEQAKLVRCISGTILDVVVDLRPNSPTFKSVFSIKLSDENRRSLLVPRGFAHGFSVLSEVAEVLYKCDNLYNKQSECGLIYSDSDLNIDWMIPIDMAIVSDKDKMNLTLKNYLAGIK